MHNKVFVKRRAWYKNIKTSLQKRKRGYIAITEFCKTIRIHIYNKMAYIEWKLILISLDFAKTLNFWKLYSRHHLTFSVLIFLGKLNTNIFWENVLNQWSKNARYLLRYFISWKILITAYLKIFFGNAFKALAVDKAFGILKCCGDSF